MIHAKTALKVDDAQICTVPNVAWAALSKGYTVTILFDASGVTAIKKGGVFGGDRTPLDKADLPEREQKSLAAQLGVPLMPCRSPPGGGQNDETKRNHAKNRNINAWNAQQKSSSMTTKRKIEVFSAGCPACEETIQMVNRLASASCEVSVLDMHDPTAAKHAKGLGVRSVPTVVNDGKLADCCARRGPDEATLHAAGLGQPLGWA